MPLGSLSFSYVLSMQVNYKFFKGKVLVYASFISLKIPNIFLGHRKLFMNSLLII